MRKDELVRRVACQAEKFGASFTNATLDTLIQSGLIQAGKRIATDGRSPRYDFSHLHYRRCLQVLRYRRHGLSRDDAVRIALFLDGYSAVASDVREALAREIGRATKRLIAPVRSKAADTWQWPKPGQWAALSREFGNADEHLSMANLTPSDEAILTLYRWARVSHLATQSGKIKNIPLPDAFAHLPGQLIDIIKAMALSHFEGMFAQNNSPDDARRHPLDIEASIKRYSDRDFERGRYFFQFIRKCVRIAPAIMRASHASAHQIEICGPAFKALHRSMNEAEWRASIFLAATKLATAKELESLNVSDLNQISPAGIAELFHSWRQNC